jgi:hypothetical protein
VLKAEAPDVFFVPGQPRVRKIFLRDASGHVTGFVDRREGRDVKWGATAVIRETRSNTKDGL